MFNIGLGELLIVLLIAYVFVGPRDLPRVAKWLGRQVRRLRAVSREFMEASGWNTLVSESEDIRREVRDAAGEAGLSGSPEKRGSEGGTDTDHQPD